MAHEFKKGDTLKRKIGSHGILREGDTCTYLRDKPGSRDIIIQEDEGEYTYDPANFDLVKRADQVVNDYQVF